MPFKKGSTKKSGLSSSSDTPLIHTPVEKTKLILERMAEGIYFEDPALAVKDQLDMTLDPWQANVVKTLFCGKKKRVTVRAAHGTGKTLTASVIATYFINNYQPSKVIVTGPSSRQTRLTFWSYLNAHWQRNFLAPNIEWLKTKMYVKGFEESWFAAWIASKNPKNAEGFHDENLLWIIEEAKGVADAVFEGVQGALSQANNFFYISSTCGPPLGYFYESHITRKDQWDAFKIPAWESPRVDPNQLEMWRREWGEDSPIYQARVAAEFPDTASDLLIPYSYLLKSLDPEDEDTELDEAA